jgi:hypothetical protein
MRIKLQSDISEDLNLLCELLKISPEAFVNTHMREMIRQIKKDEQINNHLITLRKQKYDSIQ